jgi:phospholipid/cholesterol/gamma-HCH transport system substrate-binding protein
VNISNETRVGIFTIVALTILILGYNFLKGISLFNSPHIFYAYYDKLDGLAESNPVLLYGYKVGKVEKITITNQKSRFILVQFTVKKEVIIPSDTKAKIFSVDLLGAKAIELKLGIDKKNAKSSDTLAGEIEQGLIESVSSIIEPIKQKTVSLLTSIDNVMNDFQIYLGKGGKKDLSATMEGIKYTFVNLQNTTSTLDHFMTSETARLHLILGHIDNLASTLDNNKDDLDKLISNLGSISDSLKAAHVEKVIRDLASTIIEIDTIAQKINRGQGTLGELVNNDKLYNNLESTSRNLDALLIDFKENPRRYINLSLIGGGGGKKTDNKK